MKRIPKINPVSVSIIVGLALIAGIILYFPTYFWIAPRMHDSALKKQSLSLSTLPLPERTQKTGELSEVGQLSGSGDHCDYFSSIMLKTDLSKSDLETYYKTNYKGSSKLDFMWTDTMNVTKENRGTNPTGIATLSDWFMNKDKNNMTNVIVYLFDWGQGSAADPRCGSFGSI